MLLTDAQQSDKRRRQKQKKADQIAQQPQEERKKKHLEKGLIHTIKQENPQLKQGIQALKINVQQLVAQGSWQRLMADIDTCLKAMKISRDKTQALYFANRADLIASYPHTYWEEKVKSN